MTPAEFAAIWERLTDKSLRENGAFRDSNLPDDEAWLRFGKPLFDDIDALLAEVVAAPEPEARGTHACMVCGAVYNHGNGPHTMRQCRALLVEQLSGTRDQLRTQTACHANWEQRAERRKKERDAALAEVERLRHKAGECACDSNASRHGWDDVRCAYMVRVPGC